MLSCLRATEGHYQVTRPAVASVVNVASDAIHVSEGGLDPAEVLLVMPPHSTAFTLWTSNWLTKHKVSLCAQPILWPHHDTQL